MANVAGVSLTEQTAEQVRPAIPAGPSVAITDTAVVNFAIAPRNSNAETGAPFSRKVSLRYAERCGEIPACGAARSIATFPTLEAECLGPLIVAASVGSESDLYY